LKKLGVDTPGDRVRNPRLERQLALADLATTVAGAYSITKKGDPLASELQKAGEDERIHPVNDAGLTFSDVVVL
jgi:hypothetical protein